MRIADKFAHLRMDTTVLGAARLRNGDGLLYVRRTEPGADGYVLDMLRLDAKSGTWSYASVPPPVAAFIAHTAVGAVGRPSNRLVEVVDHHALHPALWDDGPIVVERPAAGWQWEHGDLSDAERENVAYNFGRSVVSASA